MMSSTSECYSFPTDLPSSDPSFPNTTTRKDNLSDSEFEFSELLFRKRAIFFD